MALTKKAEHAIDYAIYCTDWYFVIDEDFADGYSWRNAAEGYEPVNEPLVRLSIEDHYKQFLKIK